MWYNVGEVILLKDNCRLANGQLLKNVMPDYVGKSAVIVLAQINFSQVQKKEYCHYKLKLLDDIENDKLSNWYISSLGYFKVFHDDGICIDLGYKRNETLKEIMGGN